ncbi:hypothetical protein HDU87_007241 [Geranomyces variabilis]|uniref:Uncharacterized protein n=1 Tax=Geranomyces variabilis TaxID=109894 RepID=A0AAD5TF04_9FUNG|nr:hypothetical protein HDU87_007241 [Geranomyces variabilis]
MQKGPDGIQVSRITAVEVREHLGVDPAPFARTPNCGVNWDLNTLKPLSPSKFFLGHRAKLMKFFDLKSEPMTRSFLDAYLLETMSQMKPGIEKLSLVGEIGIQYTSSTGAFINGFGDWVLAYGEVGTGRHTYNISLIGEAKRSGGLELDAEQNILQLLTYMIIVHKERLKAGKQSAAVCGFLSNFDRFRFFKITHEGSILKSHSFDERREPGLILACMHKLFTSAQASSPSTMAPSQAATMTQGIIVERGDIAGPFGEELDEGWDEEIDELLAEIEEEGPTSSVA